MTENLTTSGETPKVKTALLDAYKTKEEVQETRLDADEVSNNKPLLEKLPTPTGWRLLVLPFKMDGKTKGGIHLAETTLEKQQVGSQCGLVLKMGPQCYMDKERYPEGPWCKEGEWVMFARYAGSRIKIEGGEIRLLNDDEVLATIESPEDLLHEY